MPRMKAFDCPLFPLQTAQEKNIADVEALLEVTSTKLSGIDSLMDETRIEVKRVRSATEFVLGQTVDVPNDE